MMTVFSFSLVRRSALAITDLVEKQIITFLGDRRIAESFTLTPVISISHNASALTNLPRSLRKKLWILLSMICVFGSWLCNTLLRLVNKGKID